jgi:hypothetical protein
VHNKAVGFLQADAQAVASKSPARLFVDMWMGTGTDTAQTLF